MLTRTLSNGVIVTVLAVLSIAAHAEQLLAARTDTIVVQAEGGHGDGVVMSRSQASRESTIHLSQGERRVLPFEVRRDGRYVVRVRHSNDNDDSRPSEQVKVSIDGATVGSFIARDTGSYGSGWDVFRSSGAIGSVELTRGRHRAVVKAFGGDGYGVEIDFVKLSRL